MARLKGGKYLINLGEVEDNENYFDRLPKELQEILYEHADNVQYLLLEDIVDVLKSFELKFIYNDYRISGNPIIKLSDDLVFLMLKINDNNEDSVESYVFIIAFNEEHKLSMLFNHWFISIE